MARMAGTSAPGLFGRFVFWMCRRTFGRVPSSVQLLAHHAPLFRGVVGMERALTRSRTLPARIKTLVELRVAAHIGCPF